MSKQLLLLHNGVSAYFAGNQQALAGAVQEFSQHLQVIILYAKIIRIFDQKPYLKEKKTVLTRFRTREFLICDNV